MVLATGQQPEHLGRMALVLGLAENLPDTFGDCIATNYIANARARTNFRPLSNVGRFLEC